MDQPDSPADKLSLTTEVNTAILRRMVNALQKANELLEIHLASGQKTVPAAALHFILRDAGFGSNRMQVQQQNIQQAQGQNQTQAPKQQPKPAQEVKQDLTNQLHHNYGIGR